MEPCEDPMFARTIPVTSDPAPPAFDSERFKRILLDPLIASKDIPSLVFPRSRGPAGDECAICLQQCIYPSECARKHMNWLGNRIDLWPMSLFNDNIGKATEVQLLEYVALPEWTAFHEVVGVGQFSVLQPEWDFPGIGFTSQHVACRVCGSWGNSPMNQHTYSHRSEVYNTLLNEIERRFLTTP